MSTMRLCVALLLLALPVQAHAGGTIQATGLFIRSSHDAAGLTVSLIANSIVGRCTGICLTPGVGHYSQGGNAALVGGLLNITGGRLTGAASALVNISADVDGALVGLFNSAAGTVNGALFGIVNASNLHDSRLQGLALGLVNIHGAIEGGQVGLLNIGREVHGLQFGVINACRRLYGAQIGLLNLAIDHRPTPFMIVLNIGWYS